MISFEPVSVNTNGDWSWGELSEVDGNIEILGKQNSLFPKAVILKVIFYMAKQICAKQNKQHQATFNCTLWSDHMQQRSTVTTFSFDVIVFAMFPARAFGGEQFWHC